MTLWGSKYFSVWYFHLKTQADWLSRLATRATIPDTHGSALVDLSLYNTRALSLPAFTFCASYYVCKQYLRLNCDVVSIVTSVIKLS